MRWGWEPSVREAEKRAGVYDNDDQVEEYEDVCPWAPDTLEEAREWLED